MTDFDQSETRPDGSAAHRLPDRRVLLLVHPDPSVASDVEQILGAHWRVLAVGDGPDALRALATLPIDMLLIDQSIVRADGGDFLLEARRSRIASLPTVVMATRLQEQPLPDSDGDGDRPAAMDQLRARILGCAGQAV